MGNTQINTWGMKMKPKRIGALLMMLAFLSIQFVALSGGVETNEDAPVARQDNTPPEVRSDAILDLKVLEDMPDKKWFDLYDVFMDDDIDDLDFWMNKGDGTVYEGTFLDFTAELNHINDSLGIGTLPDIFGQFPMTVRAYDDNSSTGDPNTYAEVIFQVRVLSVNDPPTMDDISNTNMLTAIEDQRFNVTFTGTDIENDDLIFYLAFTGDDSIEGVQFWSDNGTLLFVPTNEDVGEYNIEVTCDDGGIDGRDSRNFTITVINTNDPPKITQVGDRYVSDPPVLIHFDVTQDSWLNITVTAKDPDVALPGSNDVLSFFTKDIILEGFITKITGNDFLAKISLHATNELAITDGGLIRGNITVQDSADVFFTVPIEIKVQNVNDPPDVPIILKPEGGQTIRVDEEGYVFVKGIFGDPDGDKLEYKWYFEDQDGNIQLEEGEVPLHVFDKSGIYSVTLEVSDGQYEKRTTIEILVDYDPVNRDTDFDGRLDSVDIDDDNDGMPDDYEKKYGLDPLDSSDASLDLDNDTFTNREEALFGNNPLDPYDQPEVEMEEREFGGMGKSLVYWAISLIVIIAVVLFGIVFYLDHKEKKRKDEEERKEELAAVIQERMNEREKMYGGGKGPVMALPGKEKKDEPVGPASPKEVIMPLWITLATYIGIILIVAGLVIAAVGWPMLGTQTVEELESEVRYDPSGSLTSHKGGDEIIVRDVINKIRYDHRLEVTLITFGEDGFNINNTFYFDGNLTKDFFKGDIVVLTFKVVKVERGNLILTRFDIFWQSEQYRYDLTHMDMFGFNTTVTTALNRDYIETAPSNSGVIGLGLTVAGIVLLAISCLAVFSKYKIFMTLKAISAFSFLGIVMSLAGFGEFVVAGSNNFLLLPQSSNEWGTFNTAGVIGGIALLSVGIFITMRPYLKMRFYKPPKVYIAPITAEDDSVDGLYKRYDDRGVYQKIPTMEQMQKRMDQIAKETPKRPVPTPQVSVEALGTGGEKKLLPRYGSGAPKPKAVKPTDEKAGTPAWQSTEGPQYKKVGADSGAEEIQIIEDDKGPEADGEFESIKPE